MLWNSSEMKKNLYRTMGYKIKNFCKHCTLHGAYYFYQNSYSCLHWVWFIVIGSSMCLCVYLSHIIWLKFVDNPTFTVVETTHHSIDGISFPAVSICDSKQVYFPNIANITRILNLRGYDQDKINNFFSSFDDVRSDNYVSKKYINKMHMALEHLGYTYNILLDQLSTPCHILIRKCMWRSETVTCSRMFRKVFTIMGYCCQFDMTYFRAHAEQNTTFKAGEDVSEALEVTVNTQIKLANGSFVDSFLYLYVFDSQNKLTLLESSIVLTGTAFFDVTIPVWAIDSSEDVKSVSLTNRKCFLSLEPKKDADYYQGCITLYIMQKVVSECRCIPFKYESSELDVQDYPACTFEKMKCMYNMLDQVQSHIRYILSEQECYEKCDYVHYETKTSYLNIDGNTNNRGESRVSVHFAYSTYIKYKREVLYTWDQMLGNLGGIFGLCIGGSIVSIIELLWFLLELLFIAIGFLKKKVPPNKGKQPSVTTHRNITFLNKTTEYPYFN